MRKTIIALALLLFPLSSFAANETWQNNTKMLRTINATHWTLTIQDANLTPPWAGITGKPDLFNQTETLALANLTNYYNKTTGDAKYSTVNGTGNANMSDVIALANLTNYYNKTTGDAKYSVSNWTVTDTRNAVNATDPITLTTGTFAFNSTLKGIYDGKGTSNVTLAQVEALSNLTNYYNKTTSDSKYSVTNSTGGVVSFYNQSVLVGNNTGLNLTAGSGIAIAASNSSTGVTYQITASGGGGNVSSNGAISANHIAFWKDANTINDSGIDITKYGTSNLSGLGDVVATAPVTINGTTGVNDILVGADVDYTFALTLTGDLVATAPVLINGTTAVNNIIPGGDFDYTISLPKATAAADGYLNMTDFATFNNKGTSNLTANDTAYAAGWDTSTQVPTQNAVYDKIQTLGSGGSVSFYNASALVGNNTAVNFTAGTNITISASNSSAGVTYTISSTGVAAANPFDQSLNTTNNATFAGLNLTGTGDTTFGTNVTVNGTLTSLGALSGKYQGLHGGFTVYNVTDANDILIPPYPTAITFTKITLACLGGTNVTGMLEVCNSTGGLPVKINSTDWIVTPTTAQSITAFGNATVVNGSYLYWNTTSVDGTPTSFAVGYDYNQN